MIPVEIIDQSNEIIELQEYLLNISSETELEVKNYFINSNFLDEQKNIKLLLDIILIFCEIRPKLIQFFCNLLIFLNESNELIKSLLLKMFFKASNCDESIYLNANRFYFLRKMMMNGLYTPKEIVDQIQLYSEVHSPEHFYSSTIFCYFLPEIQEQNSELYMSLFELFTQEMELITAPGCLHSIYMKFKELSANNFDLYKQFFQQKNYLQTDSIDEFQKTVSDFNYRIHPSIFGLPPILQNMPTLIQCAAFYGSLKIFKFLLLNDADVSMKDGVSRTLVHFAVAGGNLEIIHILDQLKLDFEGSLYVAAKFHQYEIFTWLVENRQISIHDGFVLSQAAIKANLREMLFLFENKVDPNLTDNFGWTPLHYASRDDVICSIKLLLSHENIDPNLDNNGNTTALDNAVINGRFEAVEFLISNEKVDINKQTKDGVFFFRLFKLMTALIYAAQYGYYDIFEILLKHPKIDCTLSDEKGRNALYHAAHEGMTRIVDLILKSKKFDINQVDSNKSTALHQACSKGYLSIVELLLKEKNIKLNIQDDDGVYIYIYCFIGRH